jgi:hypothetical protein
MRISTKHAIQTAAQGVSRPVGGECIVQPEYAGQCCHQLNTDAHFGVAEALAFASRCTNSQIMHMARGEFTSPSTQLQPRCAHSCDEAKRRTRSTRALQLLWTKAAGVAYCIHAAE